MRKRYSNYIFLLLFSSAVQPMISNNLIATIDESSINSLAQSWISWTEKSVQAVAATAGVIASVGTEAMLTACGTAVIGLVPATMLGAATYYWLLKTCHPKTASGLCLRIQRGLDEFEKQCVGDELVQWQSDADVKAFAELNFYGSIKDFKEHLRQRLKKLAVIRTYLQVGLSKAHDSSLKQLYGDCAERLSILEQDTMMKFRRACDYGHRLANG